jgi:hypothetical protein
VLKVIQELKDIRGLKVPLVIQVHKDLRVLKDILGLKDPKDQQVI